MKIKDVVKMPELLPCPFCGGKGAYSNDTGPNDNYFEEFIQCQDCRIKTPPTRRLTEEDYKFWNTRHAPTMEISMLSNKDLQEISKNMKEWAKIPGLNLSPSSVRMLNTWADVIARHTPTAKPVSCDVEEHECPEGFVPCQHTGGDKYCSTHLYCKTKHYSVPAKPPVKDEQGVFCLKHKRVMEDGICPKCSNEPVKEELDEKKLVEFFRTLYFYEWECGYEYNFVDDLDDLLRDKIPANGLNFSIFGGKQLAKAICAKFTVPAKTVPSKEEIRAIVIKFHGQEIYDSTADDISIAIRQLLTKGIK